SATELIRQSAKQEQDRQVADDVHRIDDRDSKLRDSKCRAIDWIQWRENGASHVQYGNCECCDPHPEPPTRKTCARLAVRRKNLERRTRDAEARAVHLRWPGGRNSRRARDARSRARRNREPGD